jgi:hypothetical protein
MDTIPAPVVERMKAEVIKATPAGFFQKLVFRSLVVVDSLSFTRLSGSERNSIFDGQYRPVSNFYVVFYEVKAAAQTTCFFRAYFTTAGKLIRVNDLAHVAELLPAIIPCSQTLEMLSAYNAIQLKKIARIDVFYSHLHDRFVRRLTEQPGEDAVVKNVVLFDACVNSLLDHTMEEVVDLSTLKKGDIPGRVDPLSLFIPYRKGKLWGYVDSIKNRLIAPQYERADFFWHYGSGPSYLRFALVKKGGRWGVINDKGGVVLPFNYDSIYTVQLNASLVMKKAGRYFRYRLKTRQVVPVSLSEKELAAELGPRIEKDRELFLPYEKNIRIVQLDNRQYKVIRTVSHSATNKVQVDSAVYEALELRTVPYSDTLLYIRKPEGWGIVSFAGKIRVQPEYDSLYPVNRQVFAVKKKGDWALLTIRSGERTAFQYEEIRQNGDGGYVIKRDGKWGLEYGGKLQLLTGKDPIGSFITMGDKLLKIMGPDEKLLGYAHFNGTVYWE